MSNKRIVEINGIKMEIDLRTAKRVDEFRVGTRVKLLVKDYSNKYTTHSGVIVGFDEFKELPTIVVAYVDQSAWNSCAVKFQYLNAKTEGVEMVAACDDEKAFDAQNVLDTFARSIDTKEKELAVLIQQRDYFLKLVGSL